MARTRSTVWMDFEEAKKFVQSQGVQSRQQFAKWYDENKPKRISKYPQRVYIKEWKGWNDFLGTNNEFRSAKRSWRPFKEAVLWVHTLKIEGGKTGWLNWVKENEADLPTDIPKRPDIVYQKDWLTWKHWLGDHVVAKIEAQQQARSASIYYIIRESDYAHVQNVFSLGVEPGGVSALKERWKTEKFQVVRMFEFDRDKAPIVDEIINKLSHPHFGENNVRVVPNIHELCWQLSTELDPVK